MPSRFIDTDRFSEVLRARAVDFENRRLLITNFHGSQQETDLTEPANCNGFGRIRHFRLVTNDDWPKDPLPIEPARRFLNLPLMSQMNAQVFQNAVCNWRCWYCFVDFKLLSANLDYASFLTPAELVDLYLHESNRPLIIDLSGGQPDLVPEWVPWMMYELRRRSLENSVYLWSDNNLSNDYFWRFLSDDDLELISSYRGYGKVCCFKGFDYTSFAFNTKAVPELFDRQFELMKRLLTLNIDLYCYVTLTTPSKEGISNAIPRFVDRLQELDSNLPLRTVPLEIRVFTPVKERTGSIPPEALTNQYYTVETWMKELSVRYPHDELTRTITEVPLQNHG